MKTKKKLIVLTTVIMSLFTIISLSSFFGKKKLNMYMYQTEEFKKKSDSMKYNLNDAIDIFCDYMFDDNNIDNIGFHAEIIYGEDYVFSDKAYNAKTGQYFISGYLVNGETGQIRKVERTKSIKLKERPFVNVIMITRDEFYANGGSYLKKGNKTDRLLR